MAKVTGLGDFEGNSRQKLLESEISKAKVTGLKAKSYWGISKANRYNNMYWT